MIARGRPGRACGTRRGAPTRSATRRCPPRPGPRGRRTSFRSGRSREAGTASMRTTTAAPVPPRGASGTRLAAVNLAASVRPHESGGATLRLGPLQHEAAWLALEAFLGRRSKRRASAWERTRGTSASASQRSTTSTRPACSIRPWSSRPARCSRSSPATAPRWSSRSGPGGSRCRWPNAACASSASTTPRRCWPAAREARSRADRRDGRRHGGDAGRRRVLARLSRLQHDLQPDHAGRPGGVLRERRRPSAQRRAVRDRGARAGDPAAAARPDRPAVARRPAGCPSTSTTSSPSG